MTGTTKPRIASGKKDLTFGLAGYREEVQMDQEKRNPILSIDLQIRLRGAVYEINLARCIFCGYCEMACPFDAITMGHDYEMADYNRSDLIFTKEMLLAEPLERTPLRRDGE